MTKWIITLLTCFIVLYLAYQYTDETLVGSITAIDCNTAAKSIKTPRPGVADMLSGLCSIEIQNEEKKIIASGECGSYMLGKRVKAYRNTMLSDNYFTDCEVVDRTR